jgi:hypothetical protein
LPTAGPRTIQAMHLLYNRTPATAHEALAKALERHTHAEIELLEEAVQSGADPLAEQQALCPIELRGQFCAATNVP